MNYIKHLLIGAIVCSGLQLQAQKILTKEEAVQQALDHNYGIQIAKNNVEVAENNASVFNTNHLPSLSSSAGATYRNENQDIIAQDGSETSITGAETKSYNASVTLNYTIF